MGGGKSGGSAPAPQITTVASTQNQADMFNYMAQMSANNSKFLQALQMSQNEAATLKLPEIAKTPAVDWSEQEKALVAKAKADYKINQAQKIGRSATLVSSPLLDDEEAKTTSTSLIGS